jgi:2-methylcitrate dehydratase PrpD
MISRYWTQDDTRLGIGHPGASIVSAALAVGEWKKASGRDAMDGILIGYDVDDRIGKAIPPPAFSEADTYSEATTPGLRCQMREWRMELTGLV